MKNIKIYSILLLSMMVSIASAAQPPYDAKKVINDILKIINWRSNFIVQEKKGINYAYSTIINSQRYIFYDNDALLKLDQSTGTSWASVSVLAHEMGHHYLDHVFTNGNTPAKELEADDFSGYVLGKMGASLNEATAAIKSVAARNGNENYPGRAQRVDAISRGWKYERGLLTGDKMPAPQPQENPPPTNGNSEWINLFLYGNNDMTVYLSDDGKTYNPADLKVSQPFVFKFDINNYGFLRFARSSKVTTYKLVHGKDYAIVWSSKSNNWTVVPVQ